MFYKLENDQLIGGSDTVIAPLFELYSFDKDQYQLPVEGWYWFDTAAEARAFFGLPEPESTEQ